MRYTTERQNIAIFVALAIAIGMTTVLLIRIALDAVLDTLKVYGMIAGMLAG